ncbi:MAG: Dihydroanticapsin 7-dehydrogenase [Chlamydiia bacterium]|nr:Dihydroanticapsin 7-dehydrogenase [Chlamydiia bacterium]MCH9615909.1 Dihydroanticapsin 7-dehydrogenase [Chlamydiia bacterium]MCH9628688.1 Dihydroanticapsin 7-dehydrogenase [Chlamydiia bacterium]
MSQKFLIIGGASGMGYACAKLALVHGHEVIIAGRTPPKEPLEGVPFHTVDISDEQALIKLFDEVGKFHHLLTPGASSIAATFPDNAAAQAAFGSKFWGQYFAARHGHPHLLEGGSITFVTGAFGQRPVKNVAMMAAINGAVEGLARGLAVDLAPIRVNCLAPGFIDTPRYNEMSTEAKDSMQKLMLEGAILDRAGTANEAGEALFFLATNTYTTAKTLCIDGGLTF